MFFKYRTKVFLIVFDSLHLWSDGNWNPFPDVFFVYHLYLLQESIQKRTKSSQKQPFQLSFREPMKHRHHTGKTNHQVSLSFLVQVWMRTCSTFPWLKGQCIWYSIFMLTYVKCWFSVLKFKKKLFYKSTKILSVP